MREYPHLDTNSYPGLGNPYNQYRNGYDYSQWQPDTKIRVYNVAWNNDNIVEFASETERDTWFEQHAISEYTFDTVMHLQTDGSIKLPVPFEAMAQCNYITVDYPIEPVRTQGAPRINTWCYYIRNIEQCAPNTTKLYLDVDYWQTFAQHVTIGSMQLEQGHAPMTDTNVSEYLRNPIAHTACLMNPDVSYGEPAGITTASKFTPIGAGDKLIAFATIMTPEMLLELASKPATQYTGDSTPPQYNDTTNRWGHQYDVSNYDWHMGDYDYSNLTTPVQPFTGNAQPNGYHVYAITYTTALSFFNTLIAQVPQIMQTIANIWVLADDMIDTATTMQIFDYELIIVPPTNEMQDVVTLDAADFAYDLRYAKITKLYTYPYAALELSDNNGSKCTVRIENCGTIDMHRRVSMVYPYLKAQTFLTGVNGVDGATYEWRDINGNTHERTAYSTPFTDFMTQYDIPVYALWMNANTDWALHNQTASIANERLKALNAYHIEMRNNNTGYENTRDSQKTNYNNLYNTAHVNYQNTADNANNNQTMTNDAGDTTQSNANRSANTARDNANRSNTTAQTNTNASASTAKTNADASAVTSFDNSAASLDTTWQNASASNSLAKATGNRNVMLNETNTTRTNQYTQTKGAIEQESAVANINLAQSYSTEVNTYASEYMDNVGDVGNESAAATSIMQGAVSIGGGLASGGVAGGVSSAASAIAGFASLGVTIAKNNVVREAQKLLNQSNLTALTSKNASYISTFFGGGGIQPRSITAAQNYNTDINKNTRTTQTNNINDSYNINKLNIDKSKTTGDANNNRTYTTTLSNNQRSYETATANAQRTFDTNEANAQTALETALENNQQSNELTHRNSQRSRDTTLNNAERSLNMQVDNAKASRNTAENNALESRESSEFAAKTNLEQAQTIALNAYKQHNTSAPVSFGNTAGDALPDIFEQRGVQVRVMTQNKGAIRLAGDHMLRYGYAFNGAWNPEHLQVMKHYTYWRAHEVWITCDTLVMQSARDAIRDLFVNGVTVWSVPEEIGAIDIADNLE